MAYVKTDWVDGETVATAERMNNIENGIEALYNAIFPVGQIVIKGDNKDYSNWLGFTWERTAIGKVLVGIDSDDNDFNTIGKTGGEKKHTMTIDEMPSHDHIMPFYAGGSGGYQAGQTTAPDTTINRNTEYAGGGQPHNNLQPYQVVAYWKRIA